MDFGTFVIERVVIHQIPRVTLGRKSEELPTLSEAPSALDVQRRRYFESRIRKSLQNGFEIEWDPETASPVPGHLVTSFGVPDDDEDSWIEITQQVARHLHDTQGGSSSSGLLAFIDGAIGSGKTIGKCVAVMKLELENGITVADSVTSDGKRTLSVDIENITLTESTRVFKAGLFSRCSSVEHLRGWASDDQLDAASAGRVIAEYFLSGFLGCTTVKTAAISTLGYMDVVDAFVNSIEDEEKRLRYAIAVRSDLQSNAPTINPESFAKTHLDVADQDDFLHRLRQEGGIVPSIAKDTSLIDRKLGKTWVDLNNGLRLTGPPQLVEVAMKALREARDTDGEPFLAVSIKAIR